MKPTKVGQVAKFHTPNSDEDPNQLYVVLEIKGDDDSARVDIKALNTGLSFPPISTVRISDLEVVKVGTSDLIGHTVIINKADYSQVSGKVIEVSEQEVMLDLTKGVKGVETNVWVTVQDENGKQQSQVLVFHIKSIPVSTL